MSTKLLIANSKLERIERAYKLLSKSDGMGVPGFNEIVD